VLDPLVSSGQSASAQVMETSKQGLRLKVPRAIIMGAIVRVWFSTQIAFGEVVYWFRPETSFTSGLNSSTFSEEVWASNRATRRRLRVP
jgi:hypothetical protein